LSKPTDPASLSKALGLPATEGSIYELALTHRSYAHEQPEPTPHNERLEFLGDAVIDLIVSDHIYRTQPEMAEGKLAKLRASVVDGTSLAALGRAVGLGAHLRLGKGQEVTGGRENPNLLENTFEALVGAAYLDKGLDHLRATLEPVFGELVEQSIARGDLTDPKTALQEYVVRERGNRPRYFVASEGPDHNKTFYAHVHVDEELYGVGTGSSGKEAEKLAAKEALERLEAEAAESAASDVGDVRSDARAS